MLIERLGAPLTPVLNTFKELFLEFPHHPLDFFLLLIIINLTPSKETI